MRSVLAASLTILGFTMASCGGGGGGGGGDGASTSAVQPHQDDRDYAINAMRAVDLGPWWISSANWGNGYYASWNNYLTGRMTPADYAALVAGDPNRYNDIYGFCRPAANPSSSPDYIRATTANAPAYWSDSLFHSLAAKYRSSQDPIYLRTWLDIIRDMMFDERSALAPYFSANPTTVKGQWYHPEDGGAGALLMLGWQVTGELYALATMAKAAGQPTGLPWDEQALLPQSTALTVAQMSLFPADAITDIADGIAANYAPTLLKYYGPAPGILVRGNGSNQRFIGLHGMAMLSHFFPSRPGVAAIIPDIDRAVSDLVATYSYADGGQVEQSFNYAVGTANGMKQLSSMRGHPWTGAADAAYVGYFTQMAAISTPQGGRPQVGNCQWVDPGTQRDGYSFSQTSIGFPYSGYYVQRSDWSADAAYLFFFNKRAAGGHSMAGSNSIQMGAYGRKLIVAGGSGQYTPSLNYPQANSYASENSTWKTSTLVVDGQSQAGAPSIPHASLIPARWATSTDFDFMEGTYGSSYGSGPAPAGVAAHKRMIVFIHDIKAWVVADYVVSANGGHNYTQIWKFAPPVPQAPIAGTAQSEGFYEGQIVLPANGRTGVNRLHTNDTTIGSVNLSIYQTGLQPLAYSVFYGSDPGAQYGFCTSGYGDPTFSPDVHVDWTGAGNQVVISVLLPYQGSVGDGAASISNANVGAVAGLDLTIQGKQLSIRAADAGVSTDAATLTVTESDNGANPRVLTIGDSANAAASTIRNGMTTTPVVMPSGFAWSVDAGGMRTAIYTGVESAPLPMSAVAAWDGPGNGSAPSGPEIGASPGTTALLPFARRPADE